MSTTTQPTPAQSTALHALARSNGASASFHTDAWYAYNQRGLLVQIGATTARVLELDGLVRREGKPARLVLTEAGREWVGAQVS